MPFRRSRSSFMLSQKSNSGSAPRRRTSTGAGNGGSTTNGNSTSRNGSQSSSTASNSNSLGNDDYDDDDEDIDSALLEFAYPKSSISPNKLSTNSSSLNSNPNSSGSNSSSNGKSSNASNNSKSNTTDATAGIKGLPPNWSKPSTGGAGFGLWRAIAGELQKLGTLQQETSDTYHNDINENRLSGVLAVYDIDSPARLVSEYLGMIEKEMRKKKSDNKQDWATTAEQAKGNKKSDNDDSNDSDESPFEDLTKVSQRDVEALRKAYTENKIRLSKEKKALETIIESLRKLVPESVIPAIMAATNASDKLNAAKANNTKSNISNGQASTEKSSEASFKGFEKSKSSTSLHDGNKNDISKQQEEEDDELYNLFATSGSRKRRKDSDTTEQKNLGSSNVKRSKLGPDVAGSTSNGSSSHANSSAGSNFEKSNQNSSLSEKGEFQGSNSKHGKTQLSDSNSVGQSPFSTKSSSPSKSTSTTTSSSSALPTKPVSQSSNSSSSQYSFVATDTEAYMATLFNNFPKTALPVGSQVAFRLPKNSHSTTAAIPSHSNSSTNKNNNKNSNSNVAKGNGSTKNFNGKLNSSASILLSKNGHIHGYEEEEGEEEWIQCEITKVFTNGSRYEVRDPEPDENGNPGQSYTAQPHDIIPIIATPATNTAADKIAKLPAYPVGAQVLARYPETTTFYRAEVVRTTKQGDGSKNNVTGSGGKGHICILKFEGEEEENKEQEVERRLVLPIRN